MLSPQQVLNGSDVRAACDMCGLPEKAHQNVRKRWHHCGATALNSDVIIGAEVAAAQAKMQKAAEAEAKKDDATTTATKDAHAVELERNLANQSYDQLRAVQLATLVKFLFMHRGERGFKYQRSRQPEDVRERKRGRARCSTARDWLQSATRASCDEGLIQKTKKWCLPTPTRASPQRRATRASRVVRLCRAGTHGACPTLRGVWGGLRAKREPATGGGTPAFARAVFRRFEGPAILTLAMERVRCSVLSRDRRVISRLGLGPGKPRARSGRRYRPGVVNMPAS